MTLSEAIPLIREALSSEGFDLAEARELKTDRRNQGRAWCFIVSADRWWATGWVGDRQELNVHVR